MKIMNHSPVNSQFAASLHVMYCCVRRLDDLRGFEAASYLNHMFGNLTLVVRNISGKTIYLGALLFSLESPRMLA